MTIEKIKEKIKIMEDNLKRLPADCEDYKIINERLKNWQAELLAVPDKDKIDELTFRPLVSEKESKRVEIIILKYKNPDVEAKCLEYIIKNTDWPYKLTVYDNRNNTANMSKIWNKLIKESICDYVLIMDSDAYPRKGWLTLMMQIFDIPKFQPVGVVAPVTSSKGATTAQSLIEYNESSEPIAEKEQQISGFCFLVKKDIFKEIGYFDERFYIYGQDSEWMDRIIASKYNSVIVPSAYVDHEVSVAVKTAVKDGEISLEAEISRTNDIYNIIRKKYS